MNKSFWGSFITVLVLLFVVSLYSGNSSILIDAFYPVMIIMLGCGVLVLFISNTYRDFARAFVIGSGRWQDIQLVKIQDSYEAIRLVIKTEMYLGVFLAVISFIVLLFNWENIQYTGPNLASFLSSLFLAFLMMLVLSPLETSLKYRIFRYMDDSEQGAEKPEISKPQFFYSLKKSVMLTLQLILFASFIVLFWLTGLKNEQAIPMPFDFLSILILFAFLINSLIWSKSWRFFSISFFAASSKEPVTRYSNFVCEALDLACKTLISGSGVMVILGFIATLMNLEDKAALAPNTYVSLLPLLYSMVISLFFGIIKTGIKKQSAK